jgi:hypothetical protein
MLLGAILGTVMPLAHMRGAGLVGGRIANSGGKFFFVWTLLALQVTAIFLAHSRGARTMELETEQVGLEMSRVAILTWVVS